MGNFLNNLAARSFTPGSSIRPRTASLFEPADAVPSHGNLINETEAITEIENDTAGPDGKTETNPVTRRKARPVSLPAPALPEHPAMPERVEMEEQQHTLPPPAAQRDPVAPPQPMLGTVNAEEHAMPVVIPKSKPMPAPSAPAESPALIPARVRSQPVERDHPKTAMPGRLAATEVAGRERPQLSERSQLHSEEDETARLTNPISRRLTPALPPGSNHARAHQPAVRTLDRPQPQPEPSIQVTIGRVEVRAEISSQAASRTERASSPVMSLEEYLRRRNKRGGE